MIFIVDYYHHRASRGLEGRTPFGVWEDLQKKQGLRPTLSVKEIIAAFGIRPERKSTIDKHGIQYQGNSYQGGLNGEPNLLAALHRILPVPKVDIIVDPLDLKNLLVHVPDEYQGHPELGNDDFIILECMTTAVHGRTLAEVLAADENVKVLAKEEQMAGRPFRLAAHKVFRDTGELARKRAGHSEYMFSQSDYDRAVAVMDRKGRAAMTSIDYGEDDPVNGEPSGFVAALPQRSRPSGPSEGTGSAASGPKKPFTGSINSYSEDDQ